MTELTLLRADIEPGMRRLELTAPDEVTLAGVLEVLVRRGAWFEPPVQFEDGGFGVVVWQSAQMPGYSFLVEAAGEARQRARGSGPGKDAGPGADASTGSGEAKSGIAARLDRPRRR